METNLIKNGSRNSIVGAYQSQQTLHEVFFTVTLQFYKAGSGTGFALKSTAGYGSAKYECGSTALLYPLELAPFLSTGAVDASNRSRPEPDLYSYWPEPILITNCSQYSGKIKVLHWWILREYLRHGTRCCMLTPPIKANLLEFFTPIGQTNNQFCGSGSGSSKNWKSRYMKVLFLILGLCIPDCVYM